MFPAKDFAERAVFAHAKIAAAYAAQINVNDGYASANAVLLPTGELAYVIRLRHTDFTCSVVTCGLMQALYENGVLDRVIEQLGADLQEMPAEFHPMYWNRYA